MQGFGLVRCLHRKNPHPQRIVRRGLGFENDKELEEIFVRTYGPIKNRGLDAFQQSRKRGEELDRQHMSLVRSDDYLLVDGYNIIFAWDELADLAKDDLSAARETLVNILSSYQGVKKCRTILVFDAYRVKDNPGSVEKRAGFMWFSPRKQKRQICTSKKPLTIWRVPTASRLRLRMRLSR